MAQAENINPKILAWARESSGFSLEEAAEKLGLTSSAKQTSVAKLEEFENGQKLPSRTQLSKFSAVYRRPLLTFYLPQPPAKGERGEDFRTVTGDVSRRDNAVLDALLRDIRARQEMVRGLLEDEDDTERLRFIGSASITKGISFVVESMSDILKFKWNEQSRRNGTPDDLFKELRGRAEQAGVFVLLVGDLGSHHSQIGEDVFRGFAIADEIAPFVVINDQDAKAARSFTLIHELAHLWLGKTGVSGTPENIVATTAAGKVEQFCNDVAGEFLLPSSAFATRPDALDDGSKQTAIRIIEGIAASWRVSEPMVAYRLNRLGWITPKTYRELSADFAARWQYAKQRAKEKNKESDSGPSYYVVKQFKLGNALIDVVRRTLRDNILTHTKAAKVLGVKPSSVEPLIRNLEKSRGALMPGLGG